MHEIEPSRMLWWSDEVRLSIVTRDEAARFFVSHPHLCGLWDRHAPLGALGRRFLRRRADDSIVRWGRDARLTGCVYLLERYDRHWRSGGYVGVGVSGWWHDPACWPETVKFRWQSVCRALGRGLGRELIWLSAQAIRLQCPQARYVSESCPAWSRPLIRFYRRLGFERWDDSDRRGVGIPLVPTVSLRLPLAVVPLNEWASPDESLLRLRRFARPRGESRFPLESENPNRRYLLQP